jgi:hypothetical protein
VQSAREAARRTGCSFNIRGLTQAIMVYESTKRRLPAVTDRNEALSKAGTWGSTGSATSSGYSWIFHILPYMEEGAMYNNVSGNTGKFQSGPFSTNFTPGTVGSGGAWTAANATSSAYGSHASTAVISQLICPSSGGGNTVITDDPGSEPKSWASEYASVSGLLPAGAKVAATNYKAMAGTHIVSTTGLPFSNGAIQFTPDTAATTANAWNSSRSGVTAGSVSDGMSKTVMVAETKERGYSSWIDGTTCWVVAYDPNQCTSASSPSALNGIWTSDGTTKVATCALSVQPSGSVKYLTIAKFMNTRIAKDMAFGVSSDHQGGITMHAFGDTHVAQITADVDPNVYMSICSRNGSETAALTE